ncbi:MAG: hypothetical protein AAF827_13185 [Cyanobacteria bacterium P01_D01_bin.6]
MLRIAAAVSGKLLIGRDRPSMRVHSTSPQIMLETTDLKRDLATLTDRLGNAQEYL